MAHPKIYITRKINAINRHRIVLECLRDAIRLGEITMSEAVLYMYMRSHCYDYYKKGERNLFKTQVSTVASQFGLAPNSVRRRLADMEKKGYIQTLYSVLMKDGTSSITEESYNELAKLTGVSKIKKVHRILDLHAEKDAIKSYLKSKKKPKEEE